MNSAELREAFLRFFAERGHTRVPSAPLVPKADPTLLFNVAGMVQFKPLWAGMVEPLPYKRAASVQKCLRLEDLDIVGTDATHDTFFEMLGNFSFGDYQKEEAIRWAWEFITQLMKLPAERIWVSVHEEDEEAASIWRDVIGLPKERVVYLGDEHNFWGPAGGKGACGPSSEIFWDLKWKEGDCGLGPGEDEDAEARYTEIWNLVFPQFDQQPDGSRPLLKYPGVDTGAGLERMVLAAQNVETVFHTDLFYPLMQAAADTLKVKISADTWEFLAITADHIRAATFVIAEGVRPSNTKQGYVIRRVLRRAIGALYLLGIQESLLYKLSGHVIEQTQVM
jgi:alanyl-tRNA synthetase